MRLLMLLLSVADGAAFSWRAVSAVLGERLLMETDSVAVFNEQLVSAGNYAEELYSPIASFSLAHSCYI